MPVLLSLLIGLALGLVVLAVCGTYLWRVWRPRREVFEGRRILAGMRWRELSNLVMDALGAAGFEPEPRETRAERGMHGELVMRREGRPWVIACKQGLDHRIGPRAVEEVQRALRLQQAAGAVMVTPGHVDAKARGIASNIELVDGAELWRLLEPLLPASVHEEVVQRARGQTMRNAALVLAAAAVVTFGSAWALTRFEAEETAEAPRIAARAGVATAPAAVPAPATAPVLSEDEQRRALAQQLSSLPGVDRAVWSTRSTLQVFLTDPDVATDLAICQIVERYTDVRASRLQIDPPAGSERTVRFMQCRAY